jgi:RNA binding exosome subunit
VNLATVKVARDLASELFEQNPASDWQKLYEQYRESFKKQIAALQGWLAQAERDRLPFVSELQTYQQLIQNLLDHDGAANFFRAIQNAEGAIEKYIDDRDKLNSFFGSQVIIFQEAIAQIKSLQPDLHHIQEQELRQRVETAQQILALSDPTKRIPELKTLLSPVQSKVREALRSQIEQVQQQSLKLREKVQVYVTQAHGDLGDRLDLNLVELDRVMATANQSSTIDAAIARSSELNNLYSTLINRIDQQAIAVQQQLQAAASRDASSATSAVSPDPKPLPIVKPIAVIRATSAVTKPILETEEDVKEYVMALGRLMMKEIKQGRRVRLE